MDVASASCMAVAIVAGALESLDLLVSTRGMYGGIELAAFQDGAGLSIMAEAVIKERPEPRARFEILAVWWI